LNIEFFGVGRDLFAILVAAYIQPDYLKTLWAKFVLQTHQMWSFGAAWLAPGGIEIQDHDFAFIVCQRCSLIVIKRPASPACRQSRATGGDDAGRQNKREFLAV